MKDLYNVRDASAQQSAKAILPASGRNCRTEGFLILCRVETWPENHGMLKERNRAHQFLAGNDG